MDRSIKVIFVEDSPDDAELLILTLEQGGYRVSSARVETADEMRQALAQGGWHIVVSDYSLPTFDASAALALLRESQSDVPFIVVSGTIGEEAAVRMMREGASDIILKGTPLRLPLAVERELRESENRVAKRRAEQQLAAIVQSTFEPIISETLDGVIISWNSAAERLFGWSATEAVGHSIALAAPADQKGELDAAVRLRHGETIEPLEAVRTAKGGESIDVEVTLSPLRNAAGQLVGVSKIFRDIRGRKRAEAKLRASEERYRGLIESIPALVWVYDGAGRPQMFNHRWYEYTGQSHEQSMSDRWYESLHPDDVSEARALWERCKITGDPYSLEYRLLGRDGLYRWFLSQGIALRGDQGIELWIGTCTDIHDRKLVEDALKLRDRAINAATQGILICDAQHPEIPVIYASPGFARITGYTIDEIVGKNCRFLQGKDTDPEAIARVRQAIHARKPCTVELLNYRKDGTPFWNELSISPVLDEAGQLTHFVGVQADVTTRKQLEWQLGQAQKMEAVGRLAGGVAHDFNNLLTVILGYTGMLLESTDPLNPDRDALLEIERAGQQSTALTRQLLLFSRQQMPVPKVLALNSVVEESEKMLRRMIGEDVKLSARLAAEESWIRADAGQIDQVLMNLSVNARDAMPRGGQLTIETREVEWNAERAGMFAGGTPGRYVMLSVTDTGCGMTEAVRARLFEPFFTTKEVGKGTGLGLAVVHGIVKQYDGHLEVESELGVGTTFRIFFPQVLDGTRRKKSPPAITLMPVGSETILLVEDEPAVRSLSHQVLEGCGYRVLDAEDGLDALRVAGKHDSKIDLLLTDVVMPELGGRALAEKLWELHPETKVLYVSGYTDDSILRHGVMRDEANFLQKPFVPLTLAVKVRTVLDGR